MFAKTAAQKLFQWRWKLGLGAATGALFLLPLSGFSALSTPGLFTPQQESFLEQHTSPGLTPEQRLLLDAHQQMEQALWLQNERREIRNFYRKPHSRRARQRFLNEELYERALLFLHELLEREASPYRAPTLFAEPNPDPFD